MAGRRLPPEGAVGWPGPWVLVDSAVVGQFYPRMTALWISGQDDPALAYVELLDAAEMFLDISVPPPFSPRHYLGYRWRRGLPSRFPIVPVIV